MFIRFFFVLLIATLLGCHAILKNPVEATSIAIKGIEFAFTLAVPQEIPVESTGTGSTREIAIQNALIASVQEVMGVLIVSEVSVQNNKLLNDIAIAYSNGVVTKYSVKSCVEDSRTTCTINAKVSTKNLKLNLAKGSSSKVDGQQIYSQYITNKNTITQRKKVLEYYFSRIEIFGLDVKIISIDSIPTDGSKIPLQISYSVTWNEEFKSSFIALLEKMQKDTGAEDPRSYNQGRDLKISLGKTIFGQQNIYIKLNDYDFVKLLNQYASKDPSLLFKPFNVCEKVDLRGSVFRLSESGGIKRTKTIFVNPDYARNLNNISLSLGCNSHILNR